ncbi:uncharacterized protein LOC110700368 [Chenopodium quinoa]|uniref:F-box domain-containing protein n=1 Tax=Chenopodium quinoa TaxID=63459 RepID=A0A803L8J5_CHEQI|nr:uncharacterized protein LOC110700368 [Chenopodium quinoa]
MAGWGDMPKELVTKIAEHLHFFEDFVTLSCVCSSWRSALKKAKFRAFINNNDGRSSLGREHTIPWLGYPERYSSGLYYTLHSFYKNTFRYIKVQEGVYNNDEERILASYGWLLLVLESLKLLLFNPYTGATIELPEIELLWPVHYGVDYHLDKLILSANPSITSDFIVFLALEDKDTTDITVPSMLVYWRNGYDDGWIQVVDPQLNLDGFLGSLCRDITFYQGEFYGVNCNGMIVKFETAQGSPHFQVVTELETRKNNEAWYYYLVESAGQLLVIRQVIIHLNWYMIHITSCETKRFEVLELDVKDGKVKEVTNLGDRAIFTGSNSSFSVQVPAHSNPGITANTIFNLDDRVTWRWDGHGVCYGNTCFYNILDGQPWKFIKRLDRSPQEICYLLLNRSPSLLGEGIPYTWIESPMI